MPTYEYVCTNDDTHRFEVFQRIDEPAMETCEVCGGSLRKVFHPVGVVLKGSGFYKTDSRSSKSEKKEPASDGPSKKDAAKKPESPAKGTEEKGSSKGTEGKGSS
ncbi:MAG TPA: FmdB family zinc ribbon protein [Actinomycetota bacterium]|nr:FmdB family zinc ribbon protein [Actinomycetota bacterium]